MTASLATNKFGNLTYWTNADPQSLPTESSTTTTSLKNAFDAVSNTRMIQSFIWANAAARAAQTGMAEGDVGDQIDTDVQYRYNGSGWIATSAQHLEATSAQASAANAGLSSAGTFTVDATNSTNTSLVTLNPAATAGRFTLVDTGLYLLRFYGSATTGTTTGRTFASFVVGGVTISFMQDSVTAENINFDAMTTYYNSAANTAVDVQILQTSGAARIVNGRLRVTKLR